VEAPAAVQHDGTSFAGDEERRRVLAQAYREAWPERLL
jgi:hypothetical protein